MGPRGAGCEAVEVEGEERAGARVDGGQDGPARRIPHIDDGGGSIAQVMPLNVRGRGNQVRGKDAEIKFLKPDCGGKSAAQAQGKLHAVF